MTDPGAQIVTGPCDRCGKQHYTVTRSEDSPHGVAVRVTVFCGISDVDEPKERTWSSFVPSVRT